MIVFENAGEIDPRSVSLIGVNVKESEGAIGFFGTGLKYAVACLARWGETLVVQAGTAEFRFSTEDTEIRGKRFSLIAMYSRYDRAVLAFTTELGKTWEPWMVYRELWCNAQDEPEPAIYETEVEPAPKAGVTRFIVAGPQIERAHATRAEFILEGRKPRHVVDGLEIYDGHGDRVFYRGIAVQKPSKPSIYTYNITERLWLTEDRTAGSWATDPIIARGLTKIEEIPTVDATLLAPSAVLESRLDYSYANDPSDVWNERAALHVATRPHDVPRSVRDKFEVKAAVCPSCGRPL